MHRHINSAALSYRFASPIPVITQANAIQYNPQGDGGDTALPDVSQGGDFRAIGLARLNETASMLVRRDNKYVVHQHRLAPAWPELARQFDMLEIDGKRDFPLRHLLLRRPRPHQLLRSPPWQAPALQDPDA